MQLALKADRAYEVEQHVKAETTETEDYLEWAAAALASGEIVLEARHERAVSWIEAIEHERRNPDKRVLHPNPMDDDEYCDRLMAVTSDTFGPGSRPSRTIPGNTEPTSRLFARL